MSPPESFPKKVVFIMRDQRYIRNDNMKFCFMEPRGNEVHCPFHMFVDDIETKVLAQSQSPTKQKVLFYNTSLRGLSTYCMLIGQNNTKYDIDTSPVEIEKFVGNIGKEERFE
ncbi:hypothetical protein Lal_00024706, partial [Lupinus albus]